MACFGFSEIYQETQGGPAKTIADQTSARTQKFLPWASHLFRSDCVQKWPRWSIGPPISRLIEVETFCVKDVIRSIFRINASIF